MYGQDDTLSQCLNNIIVIRDILPHISDPLIQAKTETGQDITVLGYEWVNPYPNSEIQSIICRVNNTTDAKILLFGISGLVIY